MNVIDAAKDTIKVNWFMEKSVIPARHSEGKGICHSKWMLEKVVKDEMSKGKANRWLGYAQGILVCAGGATLEEMKNINKENS